MCVNVHAYMYVHLHRKILILLLKKAIYINDMYHLSGNAIFIGL